MDSKKILVENKTTKQTGYAIFDKIPKKGDILYKNKVIYSGYGDIIDDGNGHKYQEYIVIVKELNFCEKILNKLKFYDYF